MTILEHRKIELLKDGEIIHKGCFSMHKSEDSSIKELPFEIKDGKLLIGVNKNKYGTFNYRDLPIEASEFWGLSVGSGNYQDVLFEEVHPSIGTSSHTLRICTSQNKLIDAEFISAQDIVDRFVAGKGVTTDLVLGTFALADKLNIKINLPFSLNKQTLGRRFNSIDEEKIDSTEIGSWQLSIGRSYQMNSAIIPPPERPFLREISMDDGEIVILRKGLDAVDVGTYCYHRGLVYMPVKLGVRPALALTASESFITVEGIAGSVEPNEKGIDAYLNRAVIEAEEELGVRPIGEPLCAGVSATIPGISPETATSVLLEVDPESKIVHSSGGDEVLGIKWLEVDDLIRAGQLGVVKDPRLLLNAYLIKAAAKYHNPIVDFVQLGENVGIYGGSFDPIHMMHLSIAKEALNDLGQVILIPAQQNPLKDRVPQFSSDIRLEACIATASHVDGLYVSDIEINRVGERSYTIDTLHEIKLKAPKQTRITMIVGSDVVSELHRWRDIHEMFKLTEGWIVYERPGYPIDILDSSEMNLLPNEVEKLRQGWRNTLLNGLSSTELRLNVEGGIASIRDDVPEDAYEVYRFFDIQSGKKLK